MANTEALGGGMPGMCNEQKEGITGTRVYGRGVEECHQRGKGWSRS